MKEHEKQPVFHVPFKFEDLVWVKLNKGEFKRVWIAFRVMFDQSNER